VKAWPGWRARMEMHMRAAREPARLALCEDDLLAVHKQHALVGGNHDESVEEPAATSCAGRLSMRAGPASTRATSAAGEKLTM